MNYLAHAYLSFNQSDILVGNMISDYVKGKTQYDYPTGIQAGIRLHRAIDAYTDTHPATAELKSFYRPQYRLYAGAFADVTYDYFLANDAQQFVSATVLKQFTRHTYEALEKQSQYFPAPFARMFPYMQTQDWLYHYRFPGGMEKSFGGLVRRARYLEESAVAFEIFNNNIGAMRECYDHFFPSLKDFAAHHLQELLNN